MRIKTSTLLATAIAIYHAARDGEASAPFERMPPNTKDLYGRMAKAAAEAIDRDYPLHRAIRVNIPESRDSPESTP